jgi:tRNA-splicing ligase RtcB (3'-phosphate/5'-hydroxy nucleic acid ligase)
MLTGKILKLHGWPEGRLIGLAKEAAAALDPHDGDRDATLARLDAVRANPAAHLGDPVLGALAAECLRVQTAAAAPPVVGLREASLPYPTWGEDYIDPQARAQMSNAMRLPITVAGGLMPDAHVGFGVPIGAVVATEGAVIPYGVGVDIACRMRLSLFPVSPIVLGQRAGQFKKALLDRTRFGVGSEWQVNDRPSHPVLDSHTWNATGLLRSLLPAAARQLGTSGAGNHFVEWGAFRLPADDGQLGLKAGEYLALLSHSGSRSVGYKICQAYTQIAKDRHPELDRETRELAWLELDTEAGQEYWLSMQLAGEFASANHRVIHRRVADAVGLQEAVAVENHHNFAWQETLLDGRTVIVHRKGATPAGAGVLGVIPGSMADPGYLVRGRGVAVALHSASHGAGRAMSSRKARETITKTARDEYLAERGVTLLGSAGLEESPQAYKSIGQVLAAQSDLVEVVGVFQPRLVRMAGEASEY